MPKAAPHAFHVYILTRLTEISLNPALQLAFRFGRFCGAARAISCMVSRHLPSMMCVLGLCSQQQPICLYSVFRAILRIVISTSTTRALSLGRWPQAQAHRELAVSARDAQVWTFSRRGPRNFVQSIAPSAINYVRPRFMQSTANDLLILRVPRNIAHRHQRTNDARSQLRPLASGSSAPQACNQRPQCICHVPRRFARTRRAPKQNPHRPRLH